MQVTVCGRILGDDADNDDDCLSVFLIFFIYFFVFFIFI